MIPFARVLKYGNIAPEPPEKFKMRLQAHYGAAWYLHSNGDLYFIGANNLYQGGTGDNTTRNVWTKVNTGVERFYGGVHGCMVFKSGGNIWYTGTAYPMPMVVGGTGGSWVNVTEHFTAFGVAASDIKDMFVAEGLRVLLNNGKMFFCGSNSSGCFGTGTTTSPSVFTYSNIENIAEMACAFNSTGLRLYDSSYWYAGSVLQSGSTMSNVLAFTQDTSTTNTVSRVCNSYMTNFIFLEDGSVRVSSFNNNGQAGSGNTTPQAMSTVIPKTFSHPLVLSGSMSNSGGMSVMVYSDGKLSRCGLNNNGQCGYGQVNMNTTTFMDMNLNALTSRGRNVEAFCGDNRYSFIIDEQDDMYICGSTMINGIATYNIPTLLATNRMPWKN